GGNDSTRIATVTIPADGGAIAVATGNDDAANWTNITERYDILVEGELVLSGASKTTPTLLTNDNIQCAAIRAICAASWAPSKGFSGIHLGDTQINAIKLGSTDIKAVYLGST